MPIVKNILRKAQNKPQGLDKIDVLVHEEGLTSQYFNIFDFPDNLPKGSSSFLIDGSDLLKDEVQLKVEIIDSAGNVVFTTPIPNYLEGTSRRISIEIYDDVAPGPAFLYIVGELDPTRTNVPQSFKDVYNVRYKRPIYINTSIVNTEPIIFYGQPTINVSEIVKGHIDDVRATSITTTSTITGSVALEVKSGVSPVTIPTETTDDFFSDIEDRTSVGFENEIFSKRPKNKKDAIRGKGLGKGGGKGKPTKSNTSWTLNVVEMEKGADNSLDKITSDLIGAEITFTRPDLLIDSEKFPSNEYTIPTTFSTKISEVINNTTFRTKDAFKVTKNNGQKEFASIPASSSGVTIKYETFSEETTSETFFRSFADITVGNLRTFSGDVYKAKVFTKDNGTLGDFEEIYDNVVESQQVLVDTLSPTGFRDIGFFHTQSIIDNQWTTGSITTVVTQDDEFLIDGALISGSNGALGVSDVFVTSQSFSLQNNVPYTLEFNTFFFKADKKDVDGNISQQAKMNVYLTGSAITGTEEADFYLGEVDIPLNSNNQGKIENVFNTFNSSKTGAPATQVKFEVESGRFAIQDVKLRPYSQTNFNPDFFRTLTPMPRPTRRGDNFDFLVKFYDANNNEAEVFAVTESIAFEGPPLVIDGTDNVLTGSVFLGNVSGSGIELHGGSAYIRSIGYNGFDNTISNNLGGFMLFSGSVKDQVDSSETYEGVGLEIVDAHGDEDRFFKFKTNAEGTPSEFEIQTDTFFLGRSGQFISGSNNNIVISSSNFFLGDDNGAFISGSNGNLNISSSTFFLGGGSTFVSGSNDKLEISSSNFHLDNDGSVILQGQITATLGGIIGGFIIGSASLFTGAEATPNFFISGSATGTGFEKENLFISSSGFQVSGDGEMSASAGVIGGFNIVRDGLGSANDAFQVTGSSGKITGSDVLFDGGVIGGFNIVADGLSSINNAFQVTGSSGKITGSDVLFDGGVIGGFELGSTIISSSNDNLVLKSSGQITGSDVLFDGGRIGGFDITSTAIETSDFASGLKGIRISTDQNGLIEAENVKIRGTLSTTVFEKETVNAVGGQLLVANSTMITGSSVTATDTTMSVENVSGITGSEVLMAKKVTDTGFSTEFILVNSSSRVSDSDNDLTGKLMVTRGYSGSISKDSGSMGGEVSGSGQTYEPGQVVVSTGTPGTGFIRLNANPKDVTTPYIDIVNRTGSAIYDVDLKARLGDLSGISDTINGTAVSGYGIYTDNAFLKGGIVASYGSVGGLTVESGSIFIGDGHHGESGTAFFANADGKFSLKDKLVWNGSTLSIDGTISVGSMNGAVSGAAQIATDISGSSLSGSNAAAADAATGITNAATAQAAVDVVESRVIITGNDVTVAHNSGHNKGIFNAAGLTVIGNNQTGSIFGNFGAEIYGASDKKERVSITSQGVTQIANNITGSFIDANGMEIYGASDKHEKVMVNSTGVTIMTNNTTGSSFTAATSSMFGGTNTDERVEITGLGMKVYENNKQLVNVGASGLDIYDTSNNQVARFAATTTIGDTDGQHISIDSDSIDIKTAANVTVLSASAAGIVMTGSITATEGTIGGFRINNQELSASGLSISATDQRIQVTGSNSITDGNSVILDGATGVIQVSQSGEGIFDSGRTSAFETNVVIEPPVVKPRSVVQENISSSINIAPPVTTMTAASSTNLKTNTFNVQKYIQRTTGISNTPFYYQDIAGGGNLNPNARLNGGLNPTASVFMGVSRNMTTVDTTGSLFPPEFVFSADYFTDSDIETRGLFGFVSSSDTGSSIFTINTRLSRSIAAQDDNFGDAKFNLLALEADTSGLTNARQNEYTFLQAKHSQSIRLQIQHDGDIVSKGNITAFGASGNFLSVSDEREKEYIYQISESLNKVLELRPTKFTWKETQKEDVGFIAQEVEKVIPEVVETTKGFINTDEDMNRKTISYPKLIPYLVDTIQELTKRIEELEKKVK